MRKKTIVVQKKEEDVKIYDDTSFDDAEMSKFLDVQMQEKIKKQLKSIDNQVEEIGQVCDDLYKRSYEEYKNIIDKEREELDSGIKQYISDLKTNLINLKSRINFDYKSKYREINTRLNKLIEEMKKNTNESVKLQFRRDDIKEDCNFYESQIDNMKDMNIYLKYKIKLFLEDIKTNNLQNYDDHESGLSKINEDKFNESNKNSSMTSNNISKIKSTNKKSKSTSNSNSLSKSKSKSKSKEKDKLLITNTNNLFPNRKKIKIRTEADEIEYLNQKFDLEKLYLKNDIIKEREKYVKIKELHDELYKKTNNPYFISIKNDIDDKKLNNSEKSFNRSINNSTLPSIFQNTISKINSLNSEDNYLSLYTPTNPGPGYMSRKENKEIMLKFLNSIEVKKVVYKLMYGSP